MNQNMPSDLEELELVTRRRSEAAQNKINLAAINAIGAPKPETKHTPGPWIFECSPLSTVVWSDENGRSAEICKVTPRGEVTESEGEANARLIASAPELLEACQVAERAFRIPSGTRPSDELSAIEKLRQAIAAATGGEP